MIIKRAEIIKAATEWRERERPQTPGLTTWASWKPDNRHGMTSWAKRVTTVLDHKNGYAFNGPFIEVTDEAEDGAIFLTCFTMGSRKNHSRYFDVVILRDGQFEHAGISTSDNYGRNRNWALNIRDQVRALIEQPPETVEVQAPAATLDALREVLQLSDREIVAAALAYYQIHVEVNR